MKITRDYIFFWGEEFSNFYKCNIKIYEKEFSSSEQAFMYAKAMFFNDLESADKILLTDEPKEAKKIGREVKNYDDNDWALIRQSIMEKILFAKFSQNEDLKKILLNTNQKILVEASPYDKIWGIGKSMSDKDITNEDSWNGLNLLGISLMKTREQLKI